MCYTGSEYARLTRSHAEGYEKKNLCINNVCWEKIILHSRIEVHSWLRSKIPGGSNSKDNYAHGGQRQSFYWTELQNLHRNVFGQKSRKLI